jgi:hypothetical protein
MSENELIAVIESLPELPATRMPSGEEWADFYGKYLELKRLLKVTKSDLGVSEAVTVSSNLTLSKVRRRKI